MLKPILLTTSLLVSGCLLGQNRFAFNTVGGFVIPHRTVMQRLVTGHTVGAEFTWEKATRGSKHWQQEYANPWVGIAFNYLDLGNQKQLGSAYAITPYLRLPLTESRNLSLKLGLGVGYLTQHYHRTENSKNVAIGSWLNGSVCIGMWYRKNINNKTGIQVGMQLQHFSNGAFRTPNLGINVPMISLGIQFGKNTANASLAHGGFLPASEAKSAWHLSPRFGMKELMETGRKLYPTYGLHVSRAKIISPKFSYTLFTDLMYNSSLEKELESKSVKLKNKLDYGQLGAGAGIENTYGDFAIYLQMGVYAYSKNKEVGMFYHRLGIKQQINEKQYLSFGLKSHFAKADYLELGWGIKL